jgi:hypothetical protein
MTTQRPIPRMPKKSASPADRSAEFTEIQRRLKREAAERRVQAGETRRPERGRATPRS